jgi:hypothetical protein
MNTPKALPVERWAPTTCTQCGVDASVIPTPELCPNYRKNTGQPLNMSHVWFTPERPSATKPESDAEALMRHESAERVEGTFGWRPEEIPEGAILVYDVGRWYRSGRGVEFFLATTPRRVTGRPGYWVGSVLFRDGHVDALMWGPATRPLSWWERLQRWAGVRAPEVTA